MIEKMIKMAMAWYSREPDVLRHVLSVLETGRQMVLAVHGRELTPVEALALLAHDADKRVMKDFVKADHGDAGAKLVPEFIGGLEDQSFTSEEVEAVKTAIFEHEKAKGNPSSDLSDLVQSADASSPDIRAQAIKCWGKNRESLTSDTECAEYVVGYLRNRYGHGGTARHPAYFKAFYDVEKYMSDIDAITVATVLGFVQDQKKKEL